MNGRLALIILSILAVSACGGDDGEGLVGNGPSDAVSVVAEDLAFDTGGYRASAGEITISYENQGAIEHTLVIDGVDEFKLVVPGAGDVDEGVVQLAVGEYTLYCNVAGHRDAGMEATLDVS